ncbi:hypothetical protein RHSIM_Rhsim07G0034000 [Rhododendron simsii]|uniref:Uncharacterized protein n=1 Tax=Rhododendron simsii TaxID=118357 RepID=A0A834LJK5_RHOSS|nr:hypothetical protein RHSIM_Rhsim07G0034000 [Rhododendron simsii]
MDRTPHVALLPAPRMGHLIPLVEFAKQLLHRHHISSALVIPTTGPPPETQIFVLESLPGNINHIFLPPVNLPENLINAESQIFVTMSLSLPSLRGTLKSLTSTNRLVALVIDPFGLDAFDVAKEIGVPPYLFFPSNAMTLAFCFHLPRLDKMVACEYRDLLKPVKLSGCVPVHGRDFADPVQDRFHDAYKELLENVTRFNSSKGIIVNSFLDSEEGAIIALQVEESDDQPSGSILFVSFESVGTLSYNQINELALAKQTSAVSSQKGSWKGPKDMQGLSIVHGMSLIAWPLYAQKINTVILNEGLNLALRPKTNESGIVGREEIARVVNALMEGEEGKKVRQKMKGLKEAARKALSEDGSSTKTLSELAFRWQN